jgi:heat-inducible transcriptional repressor
LKQPEYRDVNQVRHLLSLIEEEDVLRTLLDEATPGASTVRIGKENKQDAVRDYSVVTATYTLGGHVVGAFGLLGPVRMDYSRATAVVDYIASALSDLLFRRSV